MTLGERPPIFSIEPFFTGIAMTPTSTFGEHLKREREMRGVSLEEISAATRISVRFLEALENEHWAQLPGGIFNRGFIRSVARFLGMDEEGLVAEYALETRERPEIAVWTKEPVRKRRNWFAIIGTIVVLAAIVTAGWYAAQRYGPSVAAWQAHHHIFRTVMAKLRHKNGTSITDAPAKFGSDTSVPHTRVQQTANPPNGNSSLPSNGSSVESSGARTAASRTSVPPSATAQNPDRKAPSGAPESAATAGGPMELKVEAGETSTVTVTADGKTVFSGKLDALKTLTFQAQKSFTVSASKSNAVLLELNGRTVPPLGAPNQPGTITLTRDNLKSISGDGY